MIQISKNIKILFKYLIVPVLAAWLFYSLYRQIKNQPDLTDSWKMMQQIPFSGDAWMFWLTVVLSLINIGMEGLKWQFLVQPLEKISFLKSLKSILSGMAISINTPNRIGEYGGRMLYIAKGKKLKSISLSIIGSISQLIITLITGCIGLAFLLYFVLQGEESIMGLPRFWIRTLLIIVMIISICICFFYFKVSWLTKNIQNWRPANRIAPFINSLEKLDNRSLTTVLFISLFRYIIFTSQYVLLLNAWGIGIPVATIACLTSVLFLVMAVVPSFAIADLGIRGQFSLELFGVFTTNNLGIIASIFGVWLLNIFIPALLGSILIVTTKVFRERKS